jgi:hypothetical protein
VTAGMLTSASNLSPDRSVRMLGYVLFIMFVPLSDLLFCQKLICIV